MWQAERSLDAELLDLGEAYYDEAEYESCLKYLARINRLLQGFAATRSSFRCLAEEPRSILEVGCGGGDLCYLFSDWFSNCNVLGIDLNQKAIQYAQAHQPQKSLTRVSFAHQADKKLNFPTGHFDVVTTLLVCHHMNDEEIVQFLIDSYRICSKAVIINDLHRHLLAYLSFSAIAPFLFPHRMIWHDGRLSIRRSFHKSDWLRLLNKAGFKKEQYSLKWHFPFRWILTLKK